MIPKYFIGFSIPRILNVKVNDGVVRSTRYQKHYYLSGGVLLTVSDFIKLKPSLLMKIVKDAPVSMDIGANFLFGEFLWVGALVRNLNSLGIITQIELSDKFRVGYSFEFPTNSLISSNFGTHEIMVAMDFAPFTRQILKRRYF